MTLAFMTMPLLPRPATLPMATRVAPGVLQRARLGDHDAFREIHRRHHASVRRLLGDLLWDSASADDAAQETFVRAFVRFNTLQDDARLHGWLLGIARKVAMEQRRLWQRWWRGGAQPARRSDVELARSPEEQALGRESGQALEWALLRMKEGRRVALLLRAEHQLSCQDVALAMGWSVAKTKVELHRARHQLRGLLALYPGKDGTP